MGEHRPRSEPAGPVVHVEVVAGLREQPRHLGDLSGILGHVRLPMSAGRVGEAGRLPEHVGRATDGEPRRERVEQPPTVSAMPALAQLGRLAE